MLPRYTRPTIDEFDRTGTWIVTQVWHRERHCYGTKPTTALRVAAPPDLLDFVESAGLAAVACVPDSGPIPDFFRNSWEMRNTIRPVRETMEHVTQAWAEMSTTLTSLAEGADLLLTGVSYQEAAANVAEYHDIPLAALHYFPVQVNGESLFVEVG